MADTPLPHGEDPSHGQARRARPLLFPSEVFQLLPLETRYCQDYREARAT